MPSRIEIDLATSGLRPDDIKARAISLPERAALSIPTSVNGYIIPYFDIDGNAIPFYRAKLFDHTPKYKQPKKTQNYIYFPPGFMKCLNDLEKRGKTQGTPNNFIMLTEGEKKAKAAVKAGFPCVGVSGTDSWRNRTLVLPEDTELEQGLKRLKAKLPSAGGQDSFVREISVLAIGLEQLIDLLVTRNLILFIAYDIDSPKGFKPDVQRAAAQLGYEMRHHGMQIDKIRMLQLPYDEEFGSKVALDDFLENRSAAALTELIRDNLKQRSAFPRHPNPRAFVSQKLSSGRMSRKEAQDVALSILTELDARGRRLRAVGTDTPYYFDEDTHTMMPALMLHRSGEPMHESQFGAFLYQNFGLTGSDTRIINWLASQFTGEDPIDDVEPQRIIATPPKRPDCIAFQASDSNFFVVSGNPRNPLELHVNGAEGLMFAQDMVKPLDLERVQDEFYDAYKKPVHPWWYEVLQSLNVMEKDDVSANDVRRLSCLLMYLSPWLYRWKGAQLPVEIFIGEAGSGKSSLCSLRLNILTGVPELRNMPTDIRDWYASITNAGVLHVIDNVKFTNKDMQQRMSDEMCRIVTEPNPHVEMRKLFSTSNRARLPISTVFSMTAIQQPFHNADLVQRASIVELEAVKEKHDGNWVQHQLTARGGREVWIAHQLVVLHKFLKIAIHDGKWDSRFAAGHRLTHYEQILSLMAEVVFGAKFKGLPDILRKSSKTSLAESDWALSGLKAFADMIRHHGKLDQFFFASDIADWCTGEEDYEGNAQLVNARKLGRYMTSHKATIEKVCGLREYDRYGNKRRYVVEKE